MKIKKTGKGIILLTIVAFIFTNTAIKLLAANSVTEQFGIKVTGGATLMMQATPKLKASSNNNPSTKASNNSATYVFSVKLTKAFENNGKFVVCFKGGKGLGFEGKIDQNYRPLITYAQINGNTNHTVDNHDNVLVKISELSYQRSFIDDKLILNFGKLNLGSFAENKYANDETSQFITGAFTEDKTIDASPHHLGLRVDYKLLDNLDISYAYFATEIDRFDSKNINIFQSNYKFIKNGNYKIYIWRNNNSDSYYSYKDNSVKLANYGFGISADQEINDSFAVFTRFGYKNPSIGNREVQAPLCMIWNAGSQIKGLAWSRTNDIIGVAIGQIYGSGDFKKSNILNKYNYKDTPETEMELYYRLSINKYIDITPNLQYIINPNGGNQNSKAINHDDIINNISDSFFYGIRTSFKF